MPKKTSKKATVLTPAAYDNSKWEQEEDARTLARADAIKKDAERFKKAKAAAKNILPEHEKRAEEAKHTAKHLKRLANGAK